MSCDCAGRFECEVCGGETCDHEYIDEENRDENSEYCEECGRCIDDDEGDFNLKKDDPHDFNFGKKGWKKNYDA